MDTTSDAALLQRSRAGDLRAFGVLVRRHQRKVGAVALATTGDAALAEDVAQEAFVSAWHSLTELREPGRFVGWLCRIARRRGLNAVRGRARRRIEAEAPVEVAADDDLEATLSERETAAVVRAALERIPLRYREALVLYYEHDHSVREVAAALDISVAAAEQRLSRGRKQLSRSVERIVEGSLRRRPRREGMAAAVIATIEQPGGTSMTTTTSTMTASAPSIGVVLGAVAFAGAAAYLLTRSPSPSPEPSGDGAEGSLVAADTTRAADPRAEHERLDDARRGASAERAEVSRRIPLVLTRVADDDYSVDIEGGPSNAVAPPRRPGDAVPTVAAVIRKISGVVLGADGEPVAGAVVIGDRQPTLRGTSVRGHAGATTDAEGRFTLAVRTDGPMTVVAVHHEGWSAPTAAAAATTDQRLTLQLGGLGHVAGTIQRDGEPIAGSVELEPTLPARMLVFATADDEGRFRSPPLPPGVWSARAVGEETGARRSEAVDLEVRADRDTSWDAELPVGGKVEILGNLAAKDGRFLALDLYYRRAVGIDPADYAAVAEALGPSDQRLFHTPLQLGEPRVFEDVPATDFTACYRLFPGIGRPEIAGHCVTGTLSSGADYVGVEMPTAAPK